MSEWMRGRTDIYESIVFRKTDICYVISSYSNSGWLAQVELRDGIELQKYVLVHLTEDDVKDLLNPQVRDVR